MPSPVAHSLAGMALGETEQTRITRSQIIGFYLWSLFFANSPDLDFIPGFFAGNPNLYHHGATHSLGAAVFVAFALGWIFSKYLGSYKKGVLFLFLLYCSHLFLDYLTADTRFPFGEPLFWPLSNRYVISPILIFSDVQKTSDSGTFLHSLFVRHNFLGMIKEFFVLLPFVVAAPLWRWWRKGVR
ncbi:MAG: metal-dependent hydrolase [Calditrichaeota bacterium]|nr:metal-dependent hydrolase [Calditrichota bacterium]